MPSSRRARVVAVVAGLVWLSSALPAWASAPTKSGWWDAASAPGLPALSPTTASGDLHVQQGPTGPTAYAAVSYVLADPTVGSTTLTLAITPMSTVGTPDLVACPTKDDAWQPSQGGSFDTAPAYDCVGRTSSGVVSADGTSVSFLLSASQQVTSGVISLAVLPASGAAPFALDLTKPGPTSLKEDPAPAPPPAAGGGGSSSSAPPQQGATPPAAAGPADSGPPVLQPGTLSGGTVPPPVPSAELAPLTAPALPAPGSGAPAPAVATDPGLSQPQLGAAPAASATPLTPAGLLHDRNRLTALNLLAALAYVLYRSMKQPKVAPRLLGGRALRAGPAPTTGGALALTEVRLDGAPQTGGIGRFARTRTAGPKRLT